MESSASGDDARTRALHAALAELQQWGMDRFSIEGTAHRSHLSPEYIRQNWPSERQLIVDALVDHNERAVAIPDTGSLRDDLITLSLSLADYLNDPVGRRIMRMLVVDSKSQAVDSETRRRFWKARLSVIAIIFTRAAERGELRSDTNAFVALQLLTSPLYTIALYSDLDVEPDYCRTIADAVVRALSRT